MEYWKNGILGQKTGKFKAAIPYLSVVLFFLHYSIFPSSHLFDQLFYVVSNPNTGFSSWLLIASNLHT